MTTEQTVLVLLVAGHLVGEFVLQSRAVAEGKRRARPAAIHAAGLFAAHALTLYPFWSARLWLGLAGLVAVHMAIDLVRARRTPTLGLFFIDQTLHLMTLWVFGRLVVGDGLVAATPSLSPERLADFVQVVWMIGVVGLNLRGGDMIVRLLLSRFASMRDRLREASEDMARTGTLIGMLERLLLLVMVLLDQWAAVGFVLTAKSVARFEQLRKQGFSDYYMIGTLASLLVAVLSGLAARWVLARI